MSYDGFGNLLNQTVTKGYGGLEFGTGSTNVWFNFWVNSKNPGMTIAEYFNYHPDVMAQSALAISGLSGNIHFRPSYVNRQSAERVAALLTHEALHGLGVDDRQLQGVLGLTVGAPSANITAKFFEDCFR